jgi:hypothetical protein
MQKKVKNALRTSAVLFVFLVLAGLALNRGVAPQKVFLAISVALLVFAIAAVTYSSPLVWLGIRR